jgi:hypothetical protein
MQKNAFGDLRFSGRDPVEVADELRASWADAGPILADEDRAQAARFEQTIAKVLEAAGAADRDRSRERPDRNDRSDRGDREGGRRRRRDRGEASAPITTTPIAPVEIEAVQTNVPPVTAIPDAAGSAVAVIAAASAAAPDEITAQSSIPVATHDAITQPAQLPPEVPIGIAPAPAVIEPLIPDVRATPLPEPAVRTKSDSMVPAMDEVDTGWDLGEDDPTAAPSTSEMAGDGSVEGDGLDQVD